MGKKICIYSYFKFELFPFTFCHDDKVSERQEIIGNPFVALNLFTQTEPIQLPFASGQVLEPLAAIFRPSDLH